MEPVFTRSAATVRRPTSDLVQDPAVDRIVGPPPPLNPVQDARVDELLHVVGQCGLGDAERLRQMTGADLRAVVRGDVFDDPHPGRVTE